MRAITIWQPYAERVADGRKTVENRVWRTHYRGPLAIHAGHKHEPGFGHMQSGVIIAVAELVAVHRSNDVDMCKCSSIAGAHFYVVNRAGEHVAAWHWMLERVRRLSEPIEARGKPGLWHLPGELARKLTDQMTP
jgi:hypothetical protein